MSKQIPELDVLTDQELHDWFWAVIGELRRREAEQETELFPDTKTLTCPLCGAPAVRKVMKPVRSPEPSGPIWECTECEGWGELEEEA